ncbi:MAG: hypothetical protein AAF413_04730, partial [Patescibacteria group bacterium]
MPQKQLKYGYGRSVEVVRLARRVGWLGATGRRDKAASELIKNLVEMGGIYIKFVQILANLLPDFPGITPEIRRDIFSNAPIKHKVDIAQAIYDQLGPKAAQIEYIDPTPIGSGSFAVVYKAKLTSGK